MAEPKRRLRPRNGERPRLCRYFQNSPFGQMAGSLFNGGLYGPGWKRCSTPVRKSQGFPHVENSWRSCVPVVVGTVWDTGWDRLSVDIRAFINIALSSVPLSQP